MFGVALLGGVLVAEGLYIVLVLRYYWSGWTMVAAGVIAVGFAVAVVVQAVAALGDDADLLHERRRRDRRAGVDDRDETGGQMSDVDVQIQR